MKSTVKLIVTISMTNGRSFQRRITPCYKRSQLARLSAIKSLTIFTAPLPSIAAKKAMIVIMTTEMASTMKMRMPFMPL